MILLVQLKTQISDCGTAPPDDYKDTYTAAEAMLNEDENEEGDDDMDIDEYT